MRSSTLLLVAVLAFAANPQEVSQAQLIASLNLDVPVDLEAECPSLPAGAERVLFAGVFRNSPPLRPGDDGFPEDFCPANTNFFARAEGRGSGSLLGTFGWSERYCVVLGGYLVAEGQFLGTTGDGLSWTALVRPDSVPPPIPFATFSGTFRFSGGTGSMTAVSGEAFLDAAQLGDAAPGRPAGTTAATLCGWIQGRGRS